MCSDALYFPMLSQYKVLLVLSLDFVTNFAVKKKSQGEIRVVLDVALSTHKKHRDQGNLLTKLFKVEPSLNMNYNDPF